jgi:hypothetical protein
MPTKVTPAKPEPLTQDECPRQIGRYRVERILGCGGFGIGLPRAGEGLDHVGQAAKNAAVHVGSPFLV